MEVGYIRTYGGGPDQWIAGVPEMGFLGFKELRKTKREIHTFRCSGCGCLESYAKNASHKS